MDTLARGRTIFVSTCRQCHTVSPPVQGGPAMSRIAQHYVQRLGSRAAATTRIAEWLAGPTIEKSLLPRGEVERFGVMPHQPLADAGRFAVAAYVVTLVDSVPGRGRGRRR
jgi:mono/diheme cytochrome c family protein